MSLPPRSAKHPKPDPVRKTVGYKILVGLLITVIIGIGIFIFIPENQNTFQEDPESLVENPDTNPNDTEEVNHQPESTESSKEESKDVPSNQDSDIVGESEIVSETKTEEVPSVDPASTEPSTRTYIVQQGDTLFSISKKFYGSKEGIPALSSVNNLKNNMIYVGMKLIIPDLQ